MKFNLKRYAEKKVKEGDIHNEKRLQKEHVDTPNVITEKQLDKDRVQEKNSTTEKQLEVARKGGNPAIIERSLNEAKGGFHKHRNTSAYKGDINKVEEKRLATKKQEDEKYELASKTPKNKRWWDSLKASSDKKTVTAQRFNETEGLDEVDELDFGEDDRWGRIEDAWKEEEGVDVEPFVELPEEDSFIEELGAKPITIEEIRPVDSPIAKGLYISLEISPEGSQLGINELQQAAYDAVLSEGYGYLNGVDGFTPEVFRMSGDKLVARLIGDEFYPSENQGSEDLEDLESTSPFTVSDLQRTEVEGIVLGTVDIDPEDLAFTQDMDSQELLSQVRQAILDEYPDLNIEDDGIDLDKMGEGVINFVGQQTAPKRKRGPESWENVKGDPIASTDFDIVVLSNTKKN